MTTTERLREGLRQLPSQAFDVGVDLFHRSKDRHRAILRERFMEQLIRQKVFTQTQTQKLEKVAEIFDAVLQSSFESDDKWAKRIEKPTPKERLSGKAR